MCASFDFAVFPPVALPVYCPWSCSFERSMMKYGRIMKEVKHVIRYKNVSCVACDYIAYCRCGQSDITRQKKVLPVRRVDVPRSMYVCKGNTGMLDPKGNNMGQNLTVVFVGSPCPPHSMLSDINEIHEKLFSLTFLLHAPQHWMWGKGGQQKTTVKFCPGLRVWTFTYT